MRTSIHENVSFKIPGENGAPDQFFDIPYFSIYGYKPSKQVVDNHNNPLEPFIEFLEVTEPKTRRIIRNPLDAFNGTAIFDETKRFFEPMAAGS